MKCPFAPFAAYSTALGEPGKGVHAKRFLGIALNDTLMTLAAAIILSAIYNIDILYTFTGLFVLGEILHYLFGVSTAFLKMIGLEPCFSLSTV